jgi:hypothetical protein
VDVVGSEETEQNHAAKGKREPLRVRLPGFVRDEDVGLGDVVKKVTATAGVAPCSGCERRAAALNRWIAFSGRHPR